ncbi:LysE family translocator [Salinirubrum litoreum]|uniref:LysE family translocator n=1 Tax=Salinirubrum litoreum TaxID=1126234 RepID=A0ABD5R942_9EURY
MVFGLALAAPPGPMNAIIAEESVVRGWQSGFTAGLGAASADAIFFVLAYLGVVAFVEQFPTLRAVMVGIGGLLMVYFAYGAGQEALAGSFLGSDVAVGDAPETDGGVDSTGFRKAFVLALTNPYQILFWLTIGVGLLEPGTLDVFAEMPYLGEYLAGLLVVQTGSAALVVGFFGGIGVWITGFPAALVTAKRRVESLAPVVAGVSALVLLGFGVTFVVDAVRSLL